MPQTTERAQRGKSAEDARERLRVLSEQIKSVIDYRAFYMSFATVIRTSGGRLHGRCPIPSHAHSGTGNPSLSVDLGRGLFHCFSRDEGGDVFRFYELMHGVSFSRAVGELAAQLGIESNLSPHEHLPLRLRAAPDIDADEINSDSEPPDPGLTADICTEFVRLCACEDQSEGHSYLMRRGISETVITRARVVYFPRRAYSRVMRLMTKAFDLTHLRRSGLFNGREHLTFYHHRLLFPFHEQTNRSRAIYLQARTTAPAIRPRWHNMRGAVPSLYNLNALADLPDNSIVYLVEGFTDTLTLISHNFAAIGIVGAGGLRAEWMSELARFRVVSLLDPDAAGERATARYAEMFAKDGMRLARVSLPADVNDYFRARPSAALELTLLTEAALESE